MLRRFAYNSFLILCMIPNDVIKILELLFFNRTRNFCTVSLELINYLNLSCLIFHSFESNFKSGKLHS